jgi:hypothetical protein
MLVKPGIGIIAGEADGTLMGALRERKLIPQLDTST